MAEWGPFDVLDDLSPEELRQRLHSLQAIIDRAPVPIAIAHDPECRFISANRALASLLRRPDGRQHLADAAARRTAALPHPAQRQGHPGPTSCRCSTPSRTARRQQRDRNRPRRRQRRSTSRTTSSRSTTRTARSTAASASASTSRIASSPRWACATPIAARTNSSPRSRTSCATRSRRFERRSR